MELSSIILPIRDEWGYLPTDSVKERSCSLPKITQLVSVRGKKETYISRIPPQSLSSSHCTLCLSPYENVNSWTPTVKVLVVQSCSNLCDPMDCSPLGSTVHGILQARILAWVAISSSSGSSQPRDWTWVSRTAGGRFTVWATRETIWANQSEKYVKSTPELQFSTQPMIFLARSYLNQPVPRWIDKLLR